MDGKRPVMSSVRIYGLCANAVDKRPVSRPQVRSDVRALRPSLKIAIKLKRKSRLNWAILKRQS